MEYRFSNRIKHKFLKFYMRMYGCFHKLEKKIVFLSFNGKQYSDNPRAICEKMHELYPEYVLVWGLLDKNDKYEVLPNYIKIVNPRSVEFLKELSSASCFVTNDVMPPYFYKRKDQFIVQTWHGDRKFKKILLEVWEEKEEKRPVPLIDNKVVDLCVAGSDAGIDLYHNAFHYEGEIVCVGSPRNDRLLAPESDNKRLLQEKLNIDEDTKILLYAPTYRDNDEQKQTIEIDLDAVLKELSASEDRWVCLLRAHSLSLGLNFNDQKNLNHYLDVSDYPDMTDLLGACDFLITDYSSSACDFALTYKPIILFVPDIEEYQKNSRTLQVSPEEAGFIVAESNDELKRILLEKSVDDYIRSCEKVNKFYGVRESGKATKMVCNMIDDHISSVFGEQD